MDLTAEANKIMDWVDADPMANAVKGAAKFAELGIDVTDPGMREAAGIGEQLATTADAVKLLSST